MMAPRVVPDGWRLLQFSQIAESITERVDDPASSGLEHYVGLEHLDPDTLTIRRWGSPTDVEATKLRFYPGDVIYARRRAYQRKLGVAEWDGICSAHALVLRARPDVCLPEFLPHFLQGDQFHERALNISVGSLSPTINWKSLKSEAFIFPALTMQRAIVEVLGAARAHELSIHQGAERCRELLGSLRQKAALSAETAVGAVPLESLAEVVDCEHKTAPGGDGPHRVVGTPEVRDGTIDLHNARRVDAATYRAWTRRAMPSKGDLIFTREAPVGEIGRVETDGLVCLGQRTVLLRPKSPRAGDWLYNVLQAPGVQRAIDLRAAGTTTPHLNVAEIRSFPVAGLPDDDTLVTTTNAAASLLHQFTKAQTRSQSLARRLRHHLLRDDIHV
jgi:type I restriction enzyme S subunit